MSSRSFRGSWIVVDKMYRAPTWAECYAVSSADWEAPEDGVEPEAWTETDTEDPVDTQDEGWCFSTLLSPVDLLPPPDAPLPSPASSQSPPRAARRSRSIRPTQWRSWRAAASPPYKARASRGFRSPVPMRRRRCGCCCCNRSRRRYTQRRYTPSRYTPSRYTQRRYRPRRYIPRRSEPRRSRPRVTSWEHLPVAIQPTRWYQVVGSMQCSHCKALGRHQKTSWMCQSCEVPLCLMPYRNCYARWHGQRC